MLRLYGLYCAAYVVNSTMNVIVIFLKNELINFIHIDKFQEFFFFNYQQNQPSILLFAAQTVQPMKHTVGSIVWVTQNRLYNLLCAAYVVNSVIVILKKNELINFFYMDKLQDFFLKITITFFVPFTTLNIGNFLI